MQKPHLRLLNQSFSRLKFLFLVVEFALLIILFQGQFIAIVSSPQNPLRLEAQSLTEQGHEYLKRGNAVVALQTWQQATKIYQQLGSEEGVKGSQINQSLALQALGKYRQACQVLQNSLKFEASSRVCEPSVEENVKNVIISNQPTSRVSVIGLRTMGDILRVIGKLKASTDLLKKSLEMAQSLGEYQELNKTLLSLGNTERSHYNRQKDLYDRTDSISDREQAEEYKKNAVKHYQEIYQKSRNSDDITVIQAKVNHLSLLIDYEKWLKEIKKTAGSTHQDIQVLLADLSSNQPLLIQLPAYQPNIYLLLNLSKSLSQINQYLDAFTYARQALAQAQILHDRRIQAYALSRLAELYETNNQLTDAEALVKQGLLLANSIDDSSIAYQLKWNLARIYNKSNQFEQALEFYDSAIQSLDMVRRDLISINSDIQFSFRDFIKPIYQEYLELLLSQSQISQNNLEKVIQVSDSLQLAQLENFLRCDTAELKSLDEGEIPPSAIIYPIVLKDRIEILIKIPKPNHLSLGQPNFKELSIKKYSQLYRYTTQVSQTVLEQEIEALQNSLLEPQNSQSEDLIRSSSQKIYNWLLSPAEATLPKSGTLVFVTNSYLQTLPMAVLYDGNQYLVEKYSITINLGSQLHSVNPLKPNQWKVLLAGVSEKAISFPSNLPVLPGVKVELRSIGKKVLHSQLLNQDFTVEALRKQVNEENFPVIHLATHGQFSSAAEQTFIYAWDDEIQVSEFDHILQRRGQVSREPIHLIVLSACETAKGDKQAALGLAGVALRARARSVIASLWKVSDRPTAKFMEQLYEQLNQGKTKAEALQSTQIQFIRNENLGYQHPYYWSAFVLGGNWL